MKITKLGHCCMLIEEGGKRILTDPGNYSIEQNESKNIDLVLITHEHGDHLHIESLKMVLQNNPGAQVITNTAVGKILDGEGIAYTTVEDGQSHDFQGVILEAFGSEHAVIYREIPNVQNTGYFIANRLFYPGDAFTIPGKPVDILALPVAGPWVKTSEVIEYGRAVKPTSCFPVHDGFCLGITPFHNVARKFIEPTGIKFIVLELGKEYEL
ncbi:MBL fold metallo-hydrolase [Candidatus Falkowbacteria bacterium]|nr:MBL fold metallo-hydrolase [Candidatus Falkowbacteria bacterium]